MITHVFQAPSGGSWCGKAQNSNIQGKASKALSSSPDRNSSTTSGVAEASQAAPDLSPGGVKIEGMVADDACDLLAEFFNAGPFIHHHLKGQLQVLDGLDCELRLVDLAFPQATPGARQIFRCFPVEIFRCRQKIDRRLVPRREVLCH
jgi:hypothetical protein